MQCTNTDHYSYGSLLILITYNTISTTPTHLGTFWSRCAFMQDKFTYSGCSESSWRDPSIVCDWRRAGKGCCSSPRAQVRQRQRWQHCCVGKRNSNAKHVSVRAVKIDYARKRSNDVGRIFNASEVAMFKCTLWSTLQFIFFLENISFCGGWEHTNSEADTRAK